MFWGFCAGIAMYAVGVGKAVEDELREIASEPTEKHFYYSTDFTAINIIAENLKLNVCPGKMHRQGGDKVALQDICEGRPSLMFTIGLFN